MDFDELRKKIIPQRILSLTGLYHSLFTVQPGTVIYNKHSEHIIIKV